MYLVYFLICTYITIHTSYVIIAFRVLPLSHKVLLIKYFIAIVLQRLLTEV